MTALDRLNIDGVALEAKEWPGAGTPVLMLHEGLGSVSLWRDFPARLAAATGRRVIAVSRQGHGRSDPGPLAYAPDYMHREAALLPALLDALGLPTAVLFGHSDGGSIALIAAAFTPDRITALVLEAPHVFVEPLTIASIAAIGANWRASDLPAKLARHHADADAVFARWNAIWLDPAFRDWSIEAVLPRIAAPALLIQGRDDEYGTLAQLDAIEAALPVTARAVLDACGHSPHRDQLQAVLAATAAFLQEHG